ncbi:MAG: hypothetical protein ABEI13_03090 [Candidatus Paceibacteria bacterium]
MLYNFYTSGSSSQAQAGPTFRLRSTIKRAFTRVATFIVPVIFVYLIEGLIVLGFWEVFRSAQGWVIQKTIFAQSEADLPQFLSDSFVAPYMSDMGLNSLAIIAGAAFIGMIIVQLIILSQTFGMGVSLLSERISLGRRLFLTKWALLEIIGLMLTQISILLRTSVWIFIGAIGIAAGIFYLQDGLSTFLPLLLAAIGMIIFFLRMLFVWFTQSFAAPIVVYEQRNLFSARTESKQFTDGTYHKIFAIWIFVILLGIGIFVGLEQVIQTYQWYEIREGAFVVVLRYIILHLMLVFGAAIMGAAYKEANELNLPNAPLALPSGKKK